MEPDEFHKMIGDMDDERSLIMRTKMNSETLIGETKQRYLDKLVQNIHLFNVANTNGNAGKDISIIRNGNNYECHISVDGSRCVVYIHGCTNIVNSLQLAAASRAFLSALEKNGSIIFSMTNFYPSDEINVISEDKSILSKCSKCGNIGNIFKSYEGYQIFIEYRCNYGHSWTALRKI